MSHGFPPLAMFPLDRFRLRAAIPYSPLRGQYITLEFKLTALCSLLSCATLLPVLLRCTDPRARRSLARRACAWRPPPRCLHHFSPWWRYHCAWNAATVGKHHHFQIACVTSNDTHWLCGPTPPTTTAAFLLSLLAKVPRSRPHRRRLRPPRARAHRASRGRRRCCNHHDHGADVDPAKALARPG